VPPLKGGDVLLEARSVTAMVMPGVHPVPVIVLELEDGREFILYHVPLEIVRAINKLQSSEPGEMGDRESVFELMVDMRDLLSGLGERLEYVVIDEIDPQLSLYTAKAFFDLGGIGMKRRMIPSHAVFLALLFGKPIYVSKRLVDMQEEFEEMMGYGGELEE